MALKDQKRTKVMVVLLIVLAVFLIGYLAWAITKGKLSFKAEVPTQSYGRGTIKGKIIPFDGLTAKDLEEGVGINVYQYVNRDITLLVAHTGSEKDGSFIIQNLPINTKLDLSLEMVGHPFKPEVIEDVCGNTNAYKNVPLDCPLYLRILPDDKNPDRNMVLTLDLGLKSKKGAIKGKVTDWKTGKPIPNAKIHFSAEICKKLLQDGTPEYGNYYGDYYNYDSPYMTTNDRGEYEITRIEGRYCLQVGKVDGYRVVMTDFSDNPADYTGLPNFDPDANLLDELTKSPFVVIGEWETVDFRLIPKATVTPNPTNTKTEVPTQAPVN